MYHLVYVVAPPRRPDRKSKVYNTGVKEMLKAIAAGYRKVTISTARLGYIRGLAADSKYCGARRGASAWTSRSAGRADGDRQHAVLQWAGVPDPVNRPVQLKPTKRK
jgi:hypothetical protein